MVKGLEMILEEYVNKVAGVFMLPDTCFKVKELMEDGRSSSDDFAEVISVDPIMTSNLLRIANSSIYNFSREISTISRAITIVGSSAIYNMMMVTFASDTIKAFSTTAIDLKRFWRTSVFCGVVAKNLSLCAGIRDRERMFVVGLMQNLGELIVAKFQPELAKEIEKLESDVLPWDKQQSTVGFHYADLTAKLLKTWCIPEKIILPIEHFNQAKNIQLNKDIKILHIASRLALVDSHPDLYNQDELLCEDMCRAIDILPKDLNIAYEYAAKETQGIITLIS